MPCLVRKGEAKRRRSEEEEEAQIRTHNAAAEVKVTLYTRSTLSLCLSHHQCTITKSKGCQRSSSAWQIGKGTETTTPSQLMSDKI